MKPLDSTVALVTGAGMTQQAVPPDVRADRLVAYPGRSSVFSRPTPFLDSGARSRETQTRAVTSS